MQVIKSIKIRNFQTLANLEFELSKGICVFSGPSDSGKTSVIRALNWLIDNRPNGFDFRRDPRKDGSGKKPLAKDIGTECSVVIEEGEITRLRNELSGEKGFNGYILPDDSEREALKGEVPEEISRLLGISRYNVQMQHDPIFMLSDSPGEVARKINEITKLDTIDIVRKRCDGIISEAKSQIAFIDDKIQDEKEQIEGLAYIDNANVRVCELEQLDKKANEIDARIQVIEKIIGEIESIDNDVYVLEDLLSFDKEIKKLRKMIDEYDSIYIKIESVLDVIEFIEELEKQINENINIIQSQNDVKSILSDIEIFISTEKQVNSVHCLLTEIERLEAFIQAKQEALDYDKDQYVELIREVGECPMCGSLIEDDYIRSYLETRL
jgi:DNA repair protein SbcC/Rad50